MFNPPGFRTAPDDFSLRLDEAKMRARVLRDEALRDFGASLVAAARRLVRAVRGSGATRPARLPEGRAASATR